MHHSCSITESDWVIVCIVFNPCNQDEKLQNLPSTSSMLYDFSLSNDPPSLTPSDVYEH